MATYQQQQERHTLLAVEFTATLPDVWFESSEEQLVTVTIDGETVFSETLFPSGTHIKLEDLCDMVEPYAYQRQTVQLVVTCGSASQSAQVIYCKCDFGDETAAHYVANHFLSILQGTKLTSAGRLELLAVQGSDAASCVATYSDGTTRTFSGLGAWLQRTAFTIYDVSPDLFVTANKTLIGYTITCGSRTQEFEMDLSQPDCAPILIFTNSFGIQELAYCTGTHKVDPSYKRSAAYIGRIQKNYRIEETRAFKADTGPLTVPMANWWDDVFRSEDVQVCNFYNGEVQPGKQLLITDSKSAYSNDDAELPRFTFTYQYAQRNHNVVQLQREGRIFDNTFDNTFN